MADPAGEGEPVLRDFALAARSNENNQTEITATSVDSPMATPEHAPHPLAAEIIRQVEFYLSDNNLIQDAHLLALMEEGHGTWSVNEIMGFPKMRKFKPRSAVREALRQSTLVQVSKDGKRLRRTYPFRKRPNVTPKISEDRRKLVVPADKPWLTKNLLKPTGFEEYTTEGPIKSTEYNQDRADYAPDVSFIQRIETAVNRFTARRKMHQQTRAVFVKFITFGGMEGGQHMFTGGGLTDKDIDGLSAKEIAEQSTEFGVSERVVDGFFENGEGKSTYIVDFEAVTKGFLSSVFMCNWNWYDLKQVVTATNVLRNFFNYLILHDVCSEYTDQLMAARKVCDLAEEELPKLAEFDQRLPGDFNKCCSTLFGGNYAGMCVQQGDWAMEGEQSGWSMADATKVFLAGVAAHSDEDQLTAVEGIVARQEPFKVVFTENMGLEVVGIEFMTGEAKQLYEDPRITGTFIKPMGLLRCVYWKVPHAPPMDLPASAIEVGKNKEFTFLMEEDTLRFCYLGLKMEVCVKELEVGIQWIDYLETSYTSFFTWLANENIRELKESGPRKGG